MQRRRWLAPERSSQQPWICSNGNYAASTNMSILTRSSFTSPPVLYHYSPRPDSVATSSLPAEGLLSAMEPERAPGLRAVSQSPRRRLRDLRTSSPACCTILVAAPGNTVQGRTVSMHGRGLPSSPVGPLFPHDDPFHQPFSVASPSTIPRAVGTRSIRPDGPQPRQPSAVAKHAITCTAYTHRPHGTCFPAATQRVLGSFTSDDTACAVSLPATVNGRAVWFAGTAHRTFRPLCLVLCPTAPG